MEMYYKYSAIEYNSTVFSENWLVTAGILDRFLLSYVRWDIASALYDYDNVKWYNCKWTSWEFMSAMPTTIFAWGNRQHRTYFQWMVVMPYLSKWTLVGSCCISFLGWFVFVGAFMTFLASFPPRTLRI